MYEVELKVEAPGSWITQIAKGLNGLVKVIECIPSSNDEGRFLFEIYPRPPEPADLKDRIASLKEHYDLEIHPYKKGMLLGAITVKGCIICEVLRQTNSYLTYERGFPDTCLELHMIIRGEQDLKKALDILEADEWKTRLISKTHVTSRSILTVREEEVIKVALDSGYYEYPKRINLRELAERIGVSYSTLNEILHRGERKLIREYYSLEE